MLFFLPRHIIPQATAHRLMRHSMLFACTCISNCFYMYVQLLLHVQAKNPLRNVTIIMLSGKIGQTALL